MGRLALAGAGAGYRDLDPRIITGLHAWYDLSDETAADGTAVASVSDQSGNSRTVSQGTASARPTLRTAANGINQLPVMEHDGGDFLDSATFTALTACTIAAAVRTGSAVTGLRSAVSTYNGGSNDVALYTDAGVWKLYAGTVLSGSAAAVTTSYVVLGTVNGASSTLRVNGTASNGNAGTGQLISVRLGGNVGNTALWTGKIGEVLIWNSALATADLERVENYLRAKWAI